MSFTDLDPLRRVPKVKTGFILFLRDGQVKTVLTPEGKVKIS
jgi:hypothetical protein